jgi:hypothetical protein
LNKNKAEHLNTRVIAFLILLVSAQRLCAQKQTEVGLLPSINYNQKLKKGWDINFKFESRHFVFEKNAFQKSDFAYTYNLSDFSFLVGKKTGLNSKLVIGALSRIETDSKTYRTIQQFIFKSKISSFSVAHRLATDQTFSADQFPEYRLRYRLNAEVPLSGQQVDVKEFYFKFNSEVLHSLQNNTYDLEFRAVPNIGYVTNKPQKIEFGLDNRIDSFLIKQAHFHLLAFYKLVPLI